MENSFTVDGQVMEKINRYARSELTAEQVYCFSVILCDNEIDRDNEKFSVEALEGLAELFVGKTGIFDHNPKGENQTARIFDTEVKIFDERKTKDGEAYAALIGYAYMLRTDKNKDLIMEIDGGIKKEVSVSCRIDKAACSVCGADRNKNPCSHVRGKTYGGRLCYCILSQPSDAFEWSFVAVPAQINAGVTKHFSAGDFSCCETEKQINENNAKLSAVREHIRGEILKLSYFAKPYHTTEWVEKMTCGMDIYELLCLKKSFEKELAENEASLSAEEKSFITAVYPEEDDGKSNSEFKM